MSLRCPECGDPMHLEEILPIFGAGHDAGVEKYACDDCKIRGSVETTFDYDISPSPTSNEHSK